MATHIEARTVDCQNRLVTTYSMGIESGVRVEVCDFGATITKVLVPNRHKSLNDIVLGFPDLTSYLCPYNKPALGGTLGRVANRMKNGRFVIPRIVDGGRRDSQEGTIYMATKNEGNNSLNGGEKGFHLRYWKSKIENANTVKMWYESADGEEGFPGKLLVEVYFSLLKNGLNTAQLVIVYKAVADKGVITPINLTSNPYFNFSGHDAGSESLYKHRFHVLCDEFLELDDELCPTGRIKDVYKTPHDLRDFMSFKERISKTGKDGFDSVFCIDNAIKDVHLRTVAYVLDDASGIFMEVSTDYPALHFSTLNISGEMPGGKNNATYKRHGGFSFSPQMYPDASNHNNFPTMLINDTKTYCFMNCYMFGTIYH